MVERLDRRAGRPGIVGVNIGANKDSTDRVFDYVSGVRLFAPMAAYLTINISSPNTPGLRDLQMKGALRDLIEKLLEAREAAAEESGRRTPLLLKIAPDLADANLAEVVETVMKFGVEGMIVSNTSTDRAGLRSSRRQTAQAGGLSGRPVFELSTAMLARVRQLAGPDLVLVGVGGVDGVASAWSKIAAGADLVQLYTGMIYEGPSLPLKIAAGLTERLQAREFSDIRQVRGIETARWAAAWAARG
jgi:dihydroorotate dehydrogenase